MHDRPNEETQVKNTQEKRTPHKRGVSVWKPILLAILAALLFIGIFAGGLCYYVTEIYKPPVSTDPPPFHTDPVSTQPAQPGVDDQTTPPVEEVYIRKDGCYNFLVIGKDRVGLNTDVIMIVNYNVESGEVSILQLPRDTYIEYHDKAHKINSLYAYLYVQEYYGGNTQTPAKEGVAKFADILQQNLNMKIDYTFLVDLAAFSEIVNAIGGVYVDVPDDMDYEDPDQDLYIHLKKGPQWLNGDKAEDFIRFRSGYVTADIGRIDAQKIFISAMVKQIKSSFTLDTIGKIAEIVVNRVQTDMSLVDATHFASKALSVDLSSIRFLTMPGTDARANVDSGAWYYIIHRADSLAIINRYFNVYEKDISNDIFDKNFAFTSEDKEHIMEIYHTDLSDEFDIKSAEQINQDSIYIPRLP